MHRRLWIWRHHLQTKTQPVEFALGTPPVKDGLMVHKPLPQKRPKLQKPTRYGIIYYVERCDGAVLLEKRPETGLLGGMLGFPGSPWQEIAKDAPPIHATWRALHEEVRHTFTHFHLRLAIRVAEVGQNADLRLALRAQEQIFALCFTNRYAKGI